MPWPCTQFRTFLTLSLLLISLLLASSFAQPTPPANGGGTSPAANSSPPGGPSGSATIENQMLTYDAMAVITERMANRLAAYICSGDNPNADQCKQHGNAPSSGAPIGRCSCNSDQQLLLQDSTTLNLQVAASSFSVTAQRLAGAYSNVCQTPEIHAEVLPLGLSTFTLSDVASLLGAIKASATYTNQTFQPTNASMVNLLTASMLSRNIVPHSSTSPGNLSAASTVVAVMMAAIDKARTDCRKTVAEQSKVDPDPNHTMSPADRDKAIKARDAKASADQEQLKALDTEFAAFRTLLMSQTADGTLMATVMKGVALAGSLGNSYWILSPSMDGGGGDTRTRHWFLIDLFYPTWDVSYNGGAIISYTLTDNAGNPIDAAMYRYMKDWARWGGELWHTASPGKLLPKSAHDKPKSN